MATMPTMAQLAPILIAADRDVTAAQVRRDTIRAKAREVVEAQAREQGAAPTWKLGDASVSLDGWNTPSRATITDEHIFAEDVEMRIHREDANRYIQGTITLPLDQIRSLMQYMDPWTRDQVQYGLTDAGKAWAGVALQVTPDENVVLIDDEGTVIDEAPAGVGITRPIPRLVVRRKGKVAEQREIAEQVAREIEELN